jgi:hypothetical protein
VTSTAPKTTKRVEKDGSDVFRFSFRWCFVLWLVVLNSREDDRNELSDVNEEDREASLSSILNGTFALFSNNEKLERNVGSRMFPLVWVSHQFLIVLCYEGPRLDNKTIHRDD